MKSLLLIFLFLLYINVESRVYLVHPEKKISFEFLEEIADINSSIKWDHHNYNLLQTLQREDSVLFVSLDDFRLQAYGILKLNTKELGALAVNKSQQKQGLGKELLSAIISFCKTYKVSPLSWTCAASNEQALKFYATFLKQNNLKYLVEKTTPYLDGSDRLKFFAEL